MIKNKIWLTIILSIILSIFSINGFTAYYKYTQESGTNFYVGAGDKSDALEDTNEVRQILDDLGNLLNHSKRDDLYPKDSTTGGYLGRLNYGLDASKPAVPAVNDMYLATDTVKVYRCFVAGNWVQAYPLTIENNVIKIGAFTAGRIAKINNTTGIIEQGTNTDTDVADAVTKKHSQNTDTDLDTTFEATFVKKVDTVNVLSDVTSPGANIEDAVTKRHSQNADTDLDPTFEATFVKKADTVNVLSDITSAGADIEDAVTKRHTQNTDTQFDFYNALGSDHLYSGELDSQPVGESVVLGDLLCFDWATKEWIKAKADASTTMPGSRIALESKADGQTCLMLVKGYIRDDSAFDFAGAMVYVSATTAGAMTSTAPSTAGNQLQRVGQAKSADILFFDPSIDVGEI